MAGLADFLARRAERNAPINPDAAPKFALVRALRERLGTTANDPEIDRLVGGESRLQDVSGQSNPIRDLILRNALMRLFPNSLF